MKQWIVLAVVFAMATSSFGVVLNQGAKELAIEGLFDSDTADGDLADITVFYGEFTEENFEIGLQGSLWDTDRTKAWSAGVRFEHNFTQYEVVPYLALAVSYASVKLDYDESLPPSVAGEPIPRDRREETIVVAAHAGLKWFLAENVAISVAVVYEWAGNDIYDDADGEFDDSNTTIRLGMRYFF